MDYTYCNKKCQIGTEKSKEFLNKTESAYDAALDFMYFAEECFKTCPYKDSHIEEAKQ